MYKALYLHIPFCKQRCAYCDFVTEALPQESEEMDACLEQLVRELRTHARSGDLAEVKTIYLGGGTPTHFGHRRLVELGYTISLSVMLEQVEEYTLEVNPESFTPELMRDMFALGVNRLSVGVQSFNDGELLTLGRLHHAKRARQVLQQARERFDNISIDLMCGIPGQTKETWQHSLEQALFADPEHISVYPLQLELGTPLTQKVQAGELAQVDEDTQADLLEQAAQVLQAAGYGRYEVASYAKPGKQSKHNSGYWQGSAYLGLGRGAASMQHLGDGSRIRTTNGGESEKLSAREAAVEDAMLSLRMSEGIAFTRLARMLPLVPELSACFEELERLGLVVSSAGRYRPTEKGWLLGNELYARIWDLSKP